MFQFPFLQYDFFFRIFVQRNGYQRRKSNQRAKFKFLNEFVAFIFAQTPLGTVNPSLLKYRYLKKRKQCLKVKK